MSILDHFPEFVVSVTVHPASSGGEYVAGVWVPGAGSIPDVLMVATPANREQLKFYPEGESSIEPWVFRKDGPRIASKGDRISYKGNEYRIVALDDQTDTAGDFGGGFVSYFCELD